MDIFIALLFVLGVMYPAPTVVTANDLPMLVRLIRQQNKLPVEKIESQQSQSQDSDDGQSVQEMVQNVQFTHQVPIVTTTAKSTKPPVPQTQHPDQTTKPPPPPQTGSNSTKPLLPNVTNPNNNMSSTLPPAAPGQQNPTTPTVPNQIVLNVNVLIHSGAEKHSAARSTHCNHQTETSHHKCQNSKAQHEQGTNKLKKPTIKPRNILRQNLRPYKIEVPVKMTAPFELQLGNDQYYGTKTQVARENDCLLC
ncbi:uncharacterized protein LOC128716191 [Anopheles marshallii]|uniref:uncharacterized protein LOC128716191 n=1 Tax=Anopheles marshallii TaxID=1521116 RepID=UPI00237AC9C6|nr:uncharacterized protein LOC128716191 [Anopheles marshallii]